MTDNAYKAVDGAGLRSALGEQCSPGHGRVAYVIGPDVSGRLAHLASFFSMAEAVAWADKQNKQHPANNA